MDMIYISLILLFIGAGLLVAEAFMPGFGICGISGLILLFASAVVTLTLPFGFIIVAVELSSIAILVLALIKYIKKRQLHGSLILNTMCLNEEPEIGDLDYFMGKEGIAKTPLKPFGTVDFNGVAVEVYSDGAYIKEHQKVKVIDISNKKIIVRQVNTN